jgi:hypothetical protein
MVHTEPTILPGSAPSRGKLVVAMLRCLQQTFEQGRARIETAEKPEWRAD